MTEQRKTTHRLIPRAVVTRALALAALTAVTLGALSVPAIEYGQIHPASGLAMLTFPAAVALMLISLRRGDLAIWRELATPARRRSLLLALAALALLLMTRTSTPSLAPAIGAFVVIPALVALALRRMSPAR